MPVAWSETISGGNVISCCPLDTQGECSRRESCGAFCGRCSLEKSCKLSSMQGLQCRPSNADSSPARPRMRGKIQAGNVTPRRVCVGSAGLLRSSAGIGRLVSSLHCCAHAKVSR